MQVRLIYGENAIRWVLYDEAGFERKRGIALFRAGAIAQAREAMNQLDPLAEEWVDLGQPDPGAS